MSGAEHPLVTDVVSGSPAHHAGIRAGERLVSIDGQVPLDVIEYQRLVDPGELELAVQAEDGTQRSVRISKDAGAPLGVLVASAVFDRVRTCDNHCPFCFIYQLPKGMRRSLYLKDDDYRLSFLYGNFTTLTRFTELDAERILTERLGPLYVSIHATDPALRATLLRNPRGATSLRWLEVLLDGGIEVHGQVVLCPGLNDGDALDDTLLDVLDRYPRLASLGVVPLGVSDHTDEPSLRAHTREEAGDAVDRVQRAQALFLRALGRRVVHAADELYLVAGRAIPEVEDYDSLDQAENGIGLWAAFSRSFARRRRGFSVRPGFFQSVDGAPAEGYRSPSGAPPADAAPARRLVVLTGDYAAPLLDDLLGRHGFDTVEVRGVANRFFGGNVAVAGLLCGADLSAAVREDPDATYLVPSTCLNNGRFLDGLELADLGADVRAVEVEGATLRRELVALTAHR